jgi:hypothetical protein
MGIMVGWGLMTATACSRLPFKSSPPAAPPPTQVQKVEEPPAPAPPPPPQSFVQTTSDVRATRVIDVREGQTKAVVFRAATDLLSQRYTIDVSDQRAGFLMTPWQAGSTPQGTPDLRYRTRIVVRFLGEDWKQVSVRAEANWQRGDEWEIGFDIKLLDEVATELTTRIGKK